MVEDIRPADEWEQEPIDGAPKVGRMSDVVHVPFRHIPAVKEVKRRKDIAGERDGYQVDVDTHLRFKQDGREQDGRNRSGSPYRIISRGMLVFDKVSDGRDGDSADIENHVQDDTGCTPKGSLEILFHHRPKEIEGKHVEKQMPPSSMNQAVTEHPIPLFPVPNVIGIELQGIDIQHPQDAEDADRRGNQYENQCYHSMAE